MNTRILNSFVFKLLESQWSWIDTVPILGFNCEDSNAEWLEWISDSIFSTSKRLTTIINGHVKFCTKLCVVVYARSEQYHIIFEGSYVEKLPQYLIIQLGFKSNLFLQPSEQHTVDVKKNCDDLILDYLQLPSSV